MATRNRVWGATGARSSLYTTFRVDADHKRFCGEVHVNQPGDITKLLQSFGDGDPDALGELLPRVYDELRGRAAVYLRSQRAGHTLEATALVHEVYLRLINQKEARWQDRAHFYAVAATAMRQILVDHAKRQRRIKRGGDLRRVPLEDNLVVSADPSLDLVELDDALSRLGENDERMARVVELRFFAGMSVDECAAVLGIGSATVKRDWDFARTWLLREITGDA